MGTPDGLDERTDPHPDLLSAAESWGEDAWVFFEEEVSAAGSGLPRGCSPEAVTRE